MIDIFSALKLHCGDYDKREKRASEPIASSSTLPISDSLEAWLRSCGADDIEIPWVAEQLTIFGAQNFFDHQMGYRVSPQDRQTLLASWPRQLVCIAELTGDPIMVSCELTDTNVYAARHGRGFWKPFKIASSLSVFSTELQTWCETYFVRFKADILDDTYAIKTEFVEILEEELSKICSHEDVHGFMELVKD